MTLSLFRAPDLAFWTVAVVGLGALTFAAANLGADPERAATAPGAAAVASPTTSAASAQARNIIALMPAGTASGTDPAALTAWSQAVRGHAETGAAVREAEGAPPEDALRAEFGQIASYSSQLEAVADNPITATALRTQIGLRASRVNALVTGMPAPALPAGSSDLFGQTGATVTPPVAGDAPNPVLPTPPPNPNPPTLRGTP